MLRINFKTPGIFSNFAADLKEMLQRKQSLYILGVIILSAIAPWAFKLWTSEAGNPHLARHDNAALFGFCAIFVLAVVSGLYFKRRKLQIRLNRANILLNILLIGYLIFDLFQLPGGFSNSEKGIGLLIPLVSIVLLVIANRYIIKDEKLVKSTDRFR